MKKAIVAVVLVLTLALSLCACKKEKVKTTSKEDFTAAGISLEVPEGAQNLKYALVESTANGEDLQIAQITYDYNGVPCILRTANIGEHNVSAYDENKAQSEEQYDLNIGGYSSQIRIMTIDGKSVAIWTLGDHSYSLCASTDDSIAATSCAMDAANANVPAGGKQATDDTQSSTTASADDDTTVNYNTTIANADSDYE
ncbi:MAG: hypothetical protein IJI67_00260 [Clostridia bacterium]|nr:hypothetical protein [Clostridia bacterium]